MDVGGGRGDGTLALPGLLRVQPGDGGGGSMSGQHVEINTAQLQQEAQLKLYREKGAVVFSISVDGAMIFSGEITPEVARKFAARLQQCADGADAYAAEHGEDG
jgi:hypothetical protein